MQNDGAGVDDEGGERVIVIVMLGSLNLKIISSAAGPLV